MKKKILIGSIFAVALLTLVSFSSVVGYSSVKNTQEEIITDEWDFEYCKDYLFETLVEISNNEDVKDLMNSNNQNLFPTNTNNRLLMPFRRNTNRMSLSVEKLDFIYNMGSRVSDRTETEKVVEFIETIRIDNPELSEQFDTIIMNDEELSNRIYTLHEMNLKSEEPTYFPIICDILKSCMDYVFFVIIEGWFIPFMRNIWESGNEILWRLSWLLIFPMVQFSFAIFFVPYYFLCRY